MPNGYVSTGIFLGADLNPHPRGPSLSDIAVALAALNPHHNPHQNPHQNPHLNPHHNPHQNPHHAFCPWHQNGVGSRTDPDWIAGDGGQVRPDPLISGAPVMQRRSLSYHPATAAPWPWRSMDPEWTYTGGPTALLSQALRKVQARLVGERDVRRGSAQAGRVVKTAGKAHPIWRWHSEFRQQAVVGELLGHTLVEGSNVYISARDTTREPLLLKPSLLVAIVPPPKGFKYDSQIDRVLRAAVEREERLPEILSQAADFRAFFYSLTGMDHSPIPHVDELINVGWSWATHVLMMLKNNIAEFRPVQRSSLVVPIIATPGHGSLPSGHATIASMTAHLLAELLYPKLIGPSATGYLAPTGQAELLQRLAARIAFNRVVAGVHFQMDSHVGRHLGNRLAAAFVNMASETPAAVRSATVEVRPESEWDEGPQAALEELPLDAAGAAPAPIESLRQLWNAALKEIDETKVWRAA